jgi:uncharacterized protein YgiM (DUF1202 family)
MIFRKISLKTAGLLLVLLLTVLLWEPVSSKADTANDVLLTESGGAAKVLNIDAFNNASTENLGYIVYEEEEIDSSDLIMANVKSTLNIRAEADKNSKVVGKLYKDCGGTVLERGEEWSLIESGDLVGYALNEYLFFDEEAKNLAREVGNMTVTVSADAVKVKASPDKNGELLGYAMKNALFDLIYESEDRNWLCIAYDEFDGFVEAEYAKINFEIDHGETMEVINDRKRQEEEERKKLIKQNAAIAADADTERLLAALIYCEARGEPYEGMQAVGAVVMNRVRSGAYPDTVYGVIFASGQFTPAKSGSLQKAYEKGPSEICYQAARDALSGYSNVGDLTHFRRKGSKSGIEIGNHVFY